MRVVAVNLLKVAGYEVLEAVGSAQATNMIEPRGDMDALEAKVKINIIYTAYISHRPGGLSTAGSGITIHVFGGIPYKYNFLLVYTSHTSF